MRCERIVSLVVGLPLERQRRGPAVHRDASLRGRARRCICGHTCGAVGRRFSSREAKALLAHRPGTALDAVAACMILDDYFLRPPPSACARIAIESLARQCRAFFVKLYIYVVREWLI